MLDFEIIAVGGYINLFHELQIMSVLTLSICLSEEFEKSSQQKRLNEEIFE